MKILLFGLGSRGDVEPFLALGELLAPTEHEVVYAFPEQLTHLVRDGNRVHAFTRQFLDLIEGPAGRAIMGASTGLRKVRDFYVAYRESAPVNDELLRQQAQFIEREQPDLVVYHPKCMYPPLHRLRTGARTVQYAPVPYLIHPSAEQPHLAFANSYGAWFNRKTYALTNFGISKKITDAQALVPHPGRFSRTAVRDALLTERLVYAVSPTLAPPPPELPPHARVLGFHERDRTVDWTPDRALLDFLDRHPRPLLVGFGSMLTADPPGLTRLLCETLIARGIPAILNRAGGGLVPLPDYRHHPLVHFVDSVPYDWLLPRVGAMLHHGGSGTTHGSLRHGLPTLVAPHIIDQFMWNRRVAQLGAGPLGVSVRQLNRARLDRLVTDLLTNSTYRTRAAALAAQMHGEAALAQRMVEFVLG